MLATIHKDYDEFQSRRQKRQQHGLGEPEVYGDGEQSMSLYLCQVALFVYKASMLI